MAKLYPAKLVALLAIGVVALVALACSGGEEEADVANPGSNSSSGLSATVYASPT
jgi:hypothetical protein